MTSAQSIRPGVEIIQEIRRTSPVVLTPTLTPCVVGVCRQIIEVLEDDGTINGDALLQGPAVATATNVQASYSVNGDTLIVSVNDGPEQTFTFVGTDPLTAQQAATSINGASPAPNGFAAYAYQDGLGYHLQLRTTAAGESQSIRIVGGTALTALGWDSHVGYTYYGIGTYRNYKVSVPQTSLPDPRSIIDELDVEEDSLRCFVDLGTEVREFLRSESFLRAGSSIAVVDDGDGDATSPLFNLSESLIAAATSAKTAVGTEDLSVDAEVHNTTLTVAIDGAKPQTVSFVGQPIVSVDSTGWTMANIQSNTLILSVNGTTVTVTFSGSVADLDGVIAEINAEAAATLGLGTIVAYKAGAWGQVDAVGTYLGFFYGGAPPTVVEGSAVSVTGGTAISEIMGGAGPYLQVNQSVKQDALQPIDGILDQINTLLGETVAKEDATHHLYLESTSKGAESTVWVSSASTALTPLGLTAGWSFGSPFPVRQGDALYADGALLGQVTQVHVGGVSGRVKINREVALTSTYSSWYIVAKNLDLVSTALWGVSVPTPDFYVDTAGNLQVKHHVLRDTVGSPVTLSAGVSFYVAYTAIRLDVTAEAANPALVSFGDTDSLDTALGPIRPDNPLAYGIFCALQNSGNNQVAGLGVSEVSDDAPYGTLTAWTAAFDFLRSKQVYGLAPMTNDLDALLVGRTHVLAMSEPTRKGERVMHCCLGRPSRSANTLVVSGTDGDLISDGPPAVFDTKVATLSQQLLAAGLDPTNLTVADGVFIDIASDSLRWNVTGSVTNGTELTVNTTFAPGENDDSFYATGSFPVAISETFSVVIRGATITDDKDAEIETIAAWAEGFGSRRVRLAQLDKLKATVEGVDQLVEGFYICAARVGQMAGNLASQPYTEYPVAGFTGVTGSNDIYEEELMATAAASGVEWFLQEGAGAPVKSRHQMTTDPTSVEAQEQSITNALDFGAYLLRSVLRFYTGRYNITETYYDTLAMVIDGCVDYLVSKKIWAGASLNSLQQSTSDPRNTLVSVTVQPLYPSNRIILTLIV